MFPKSNQQVKIAIHVYAPESGRCEAQAAREP